MMLSSTCQSAIEIVRDHVGGNQIRHVPKSSAIRCGHDRIGRCAPDGSGRSHGTPRSRASAATPYGIHARRLRSASPTEKVSLDAATIKTGKEIWLAAQAA